MTEMFIAKTQIDDSADALKYYGMTMEDGEDIDEVIHKLINLSIKINVNPLNKEETVYADTYYTYECEEYIVIATIGNKVVTNHEFEEFNTLLADNEYLFELAGVEDKGMFNGEIEKYREYFEGYEVARYIIKEGIENGKFKVYSTLNELLECEGLVCEKVRTDKESKFIRLKLENSINEEVCNLDKLREIRSTLINAVYRGYAIATIVYGDEKYRDLLVEKEVDGETYYSLTQELNYIDVIREYLTAYCVFSSLVEGMEIW